MTCYCDAYPFPHRLGGGKCKASGETSCLECGAILGDDQVEVYQVRQESYYLPAEYDQRIESGCPRCGAQ